SDTSLLTGPLRSAAVISPPAAVGRRGNTENGGHLKKACAEFEALFINQLLKELRATVEKSGLMDGGQAEEVYTGMMDAEIARDLASKGGIGLAAILYRQLSSTSAMTTGSVDEGTLTRDRQALSGAAAAKVIGTRRR
ncbi:MAG: rod-binding protein, partial [Desulfobacterales bacterium]